MAKGEQYEARVEAWITPVLEQHQFELVDVEYVREVGHDSVEVGSNAKYAAIHHFGGVIRAKNAGALRFRIGESFVMKKAVTMPARPALGLNGEDEDHIMETTEDWIAGFVREIK